MRITTILYLLAWFAVPAHAQFTTIAESQAFQEPADGSARILQLKNGNTLFLHYTARNGLAIQLFDSAHRRIDTLPTPTNWAAWKGGNLDAAFETGGNATLFISDREQKHPRMKRLTINGHTGQLQEDSVIADLDKINLRKKRVISASDFLVIKDPWSESYAIWMYFNTEEETDGGYQIVHFGAGHREISRARFKNFDNEVPFQYWDMAVIGEEQLCILGMEEYKTPEKDSTVLKLATLEKGRIFFAFHDLKFPKGLNTVGAFIKYNPHTDQLLLMQAVKEEEKKAARTTTFLATVKLHSMNISYSKEIYLDKVNRKSLEVFGPKEEYAGVPQNIFIKQDGSYAIVFEELDNHVRMMNNIPTVISTVLANVAVVDFNAEGKEVNSWMIPKRQINQGVIMKPFYLKNRENVQEKHNWDDQYKFFTYIPGYILVNDLDEKHKQLERGKQAAIRDISNCHGYFYSLEGEETIPMRDLVFSPEDRQVAMFSIADYDAEKRRLVTLKRTPESRRDVKLVWLNVTPPEKQDGREAMAKGN
ncbi:hypothetical protein EG028_03850 [Chitinophaga barathri]|uniref:S9 family peptidase n=2 Tax=Chitinophaga barathri TaxID=1647451 RepID=A0A3N4MET4_9BACT|nr:hypothetical protein EG028_03850 [Chitinophaga barathri]